MPRKKTEDTCGLDKCVKKGQCSLYSEKEKASHKRTSDKADFKCGYFSGIYRQPELV